jgi:hypothetical protein
LSQLGSPALIRFPYRLKTGIGSFSFYEPTAVKVDSILSREASRVFEVVQVADVLFIRRRSASALAH